MAFRSNRANSIVLNLPGGEVAERRLEESGVGRRPECPDLWNIALSWVLDPE